MVVFTAIGVLFCRDQARYITALAALQRLDESLGESIELTLPQQG